MITFVCEEDDELCDLYLISSFKILLLTFSIFATLFGAVFVSEIFRVSHDFGKEGSTIRASTSLSNFVSIPDN